jgi:hypothetical protein
MALTAYDVDDKYILDIFQVSCCLLGRAERWNLGLDLKLICKERGALHVDTILDFGGYFGL